MDWDALTTNGMCNMVGMTCTTGTSSTGSCTVDSDCRVAVGQVQALPVSGVNFSCASLLNSTTTGATLVTSLPALDIANPIQNVFHDLDVGIVFAAK